MCGSVLWSAFNPDAAPMLFCREQGVLEKFQYTQSNKINGGDDQIIERLEQQVLSSFRIKVLGWLTTSLYMAISREIQYRYREDQSPNDLNLTDFPCSYKRL